VFSGEPEEVVIEFDADAAPYVREREWHRTQQLTDRADGSVLMRLHVCVDQPLRQWVLGFGPAARVVSPGRLAAEIFEAAEGMRARYATKRPVLRSAERVSRNRGLRGSRS
jgi:predicted DNA-binding transcriptional regulator YafY